MQDDGIETLACRIFCGARTDLLDIFVGRKVWYEWPPQLHLGEDEWSPLM